MSFRTKTVSGEWLVDQDIELDELIIEEGGKIVAPEGKFVTLTVRGVGRQIEPGYYAGDISLTVRDLYIMTPHGLFLAIGRDTPFHTALVVNDNQIDEAKSATAVISEGEITGTHADGVHMVSNEESFNGILLTGNTDYEINNANIELDGFSGNDFVGLGAGVAAIDNAHLTMNDSRIVMHGVTRCAVHVGGDSVVTANNCTFINHSPVYDEWMGEFSWGCAFDGTNRLVQLCDNGTAIYNNCTFDTNGWGIASIDGCDDSVAYYFNGCDMNCSGSRSHGYGSFCIGDRNVVSFNNTKVHCTAYPMILRGMTGQARAEFVNGCDVTSDQFAVIAIGDNMTPMLIADSDVAAKSAVICSKGSASTYTIRNSTLTSEAGVIMQMMDNDECGMFIKTVRIPVGKVDVYDPNHDLYTVDPTNDVVMNLEDMIISGDFLNSTTNLHLEKDAIPGHCDKPPAFGGMFEPPEGSDGLSFLDAPEAEGSDHAKETEYDAELRGPKNLVLNLVNTRMESIASAATAAYREGLTEIDEANRYELSCITQTPAPTVNNGVIVSLDKDSTWIVTGTSYITKLTLEAGAILKAPAGKKVVMTVDGTETAIAAGTYQGKIVLTVA
jgi:hypothetical protein